MNRRDFIRSAVAGTMAASEISCSNQPVGNKSGKSATYAQNGTLALPADLAPAGLRCEYLEDPVGIDEARPRFGWIGVSNARGLRQHAYRIIVATTRAHLDANRGDMWDSGRVLSSQQNQVVYGGGNLASGSRYFWKVGVWYSPGDDIRWSQPAHFETGLLHPADWRARWIAQRPDAAWRRDWDARRAQQAKARFNQSEHDLWNVQQFFQPPYEAAPLFRREIELHSQVVAARVYVCGLGYYQLYLNGDKVGSSVLDPAWTNYDKRVLYTTYDVTPYLRPGKNTIGVMLGRGWYTPIWGIAKLDEANWVNQPRLILQMHITYADGSRDFVGSDREWRVTSGPVLFDCVMSGEVYDARREVAGWCQNEDNTSVWSQAQEVTAPEGVLRAQMIPPIRLVETVPPAAVTRAGAGIQVCDFGQNLSGWVRLRVRGRAGDRVVLDFKETLNADGTVERAVGGNPSKHTQAVYLLKGGGEEAYESAFVYWGFRYVQITSHRPTEGGQPEPAVAAEVLGIEGRFVHTDLAETGSFRCSHPLVNRLHENIIRTLRCNLHGMQTDCPTREKIGWTGDNHLTAEIATFAFDTARLNTKWLDDLRDRQEEHGRIPGYAPRQANFPRPWDAPPWTIAYALLPWHMYQYYGDRRILEEHYPNMTRWLRGIEHQVGEPGRPRIVKGGASDWAAPQTPSSMEEGTLFWGTLFYQHSAEVMARIAGTLGKDRDRAEFTQLADEIRSVFNTTFFAAEAGYYKVEKHTVYRQSANAVPLLLGVVPVASRRRVEERLIYDLSVLQKDHLDTGILGTKAVMELLPRLGHHELAFRLLIQTTYPSWGWQIREHGATTLWEYWDAQRSRNHPMFGSVGAYLYKYLAGIQNMPGTYGFGEVLIKPHVPSGMEWAEASYHSVRGRIATKWSKSEGRFALAVTLPANTSGTVVLPVADIRDTTVTESGIVIWKSGAADTSNNASVVFHGVGDDLGAAGKSLVFEIESGHYEFQVKNGVLDANGPTTGRKKS